MLKPFTETNQLSERLKKILTITQNCKVKADVRKNWNDNVNSLISDVQVQNLTKDFLKLSNNLKKFNMLIVSH